MRDEILSEPWTMRWTPALHLLRLKDFGRIVFRSDLGRDWGEASLKDKMLSRHWPRWAWLVATACVEYWEEPDNKGDLEGEVAR